MSVAGALALAERVACGEWREEDHPRDDDGRFTHAASITGDELHAVRDWQPRNPLAEQAAEDLLDGGSGVVLRERGRIVGVAAVVEGAHMELPNGQPLRVDWISHGGTAGKGAGYGRRLFRLLAQRASARGFGLALTPTDESRGFYERLGFATFQGDDGGDVMYLDEDATRRFAGRAVKADWREEDHPRDWRGRFTDKDVEVRPAGWDASATDFAAMGRPGHLYRGMTQAEYDATIGAGKPLRSTGQWSAAGEGTNFAEDLDSAESYANYGQTDPRKTGAPTYVVEITREGETVAEDGYVKLQGDVPLSRVTRVLHMRADGDRVVGRWEERVTKGDDEDGDGRAWDPSEHPRDERGRFARKPSAGYMAEVKADANARIAAEIKRTGVGYAGADVYYALGKRQSDEETFALAEHVEKASDREAMYRALGSQSEWNTKWATAIDEWNAAHGLGANGAMSRTTRDELKGSKPLSDVELAAFSARMEFVQDIVGERIGKTLTLYRGFRGAYARKVLAAVGTDDVVDLPVYGLSSWTDNPRRAREFAGKAGVVVKATVSLSDVWNASGIGVQNVTRFSDDHGEVVTLNREATRRVTLFRGAR